MRTLKGIEDTLCGMFVSNFKLKGEEQNTQARETAKETIQFLQEEDNLVVPPSGFKIEVLELIQTLKEQAKLDYDKSEKTFWEGYYSGVCDILEELYEKLQGMKQ